MTPSHRLLPLDVLRAVAIFLVMASHMHQPPEHWPAALIALTHAGARGGWIGVDLFFVLSGFLISGLLFREYQRFGQIRFGHFFVRRGLKIYPAFYAMIGITVAIKCWRGQEPAVGEVLREVLFIQNYGSGVWTHTWSLAVEEHFYIFVPLLLIALHRLARRGDNPFRSVPAIFLIMAVLLLAMRVLTTANLEFTDRTHRFPTHLRMDSLMFGVFLSYFYHFHQQAFAAWSARYAWILGLGGIALMTPAFVFDTRSTPLIPTVGFSLFYLGGGMILTAAVVRGLPTNRLTKLIGYIGSHSYSIYLWHAPVLAWAPYVLLRLLGHKPPWLLDLGAFVLGSLVVGIGMSHLIELPVLRLRDRLFPSRSRPLSAAPTAQ